MREGMLFAAAALVGFAACGACRVLARRLGILDRPGGRKGHGEPVPLLGGVGVACGCAAGLAVFAVGGPGGGIGGIGGMAGWLVAGALVTSLGGLLDDLRTGGLAPSRKLAWQAAGGALAAAGVGLSGRWWGGGGGFAAAAGLFVLVLVATNTFNLLDNMNGLSPGVALVLCLGIAAAAHRATPAPPPRIVPASALALVLAGAVAGFLPHNFPRARLFLGDAGSQLLGYVVAVGCALAVGPAGGGGGVRAAILFSATLLALPLVDTAWVVARRLREGRSIFRGDRGHLSHRLVDAGLSEPGAVGVLWLYAAATAALATRVPGTSPGGALLLVVAAWVPAGVLVAIAVRAGRIPTG